MVCGATGPAVPGVGNFYSSGILHANIMTAIPM